jgi:hypothetical protein
MGIIFRRRGRSFQLLVPDQSACSTYFVSSFLYQNHIITNTRSVGEGHPSLDFYQHLTS